MPLPHTKEKLQDAGYVFDNEGRCKGETCGALIEWWIAPDGHKLPMSVVAVKRHPDRELSQVIGYKRILHFIDCPDRKDFRREKTK